MEVKKKLSVFDIVNLAVCGVGFVLTIIATISFISSNKQVEMEKTNFVFSIIGNIAMFLAYIFALFYMLARYTKKAAILYKLFMYAYMIKAIVTALLSMSYGTGSVFTSLLILAVVLLSVILATAKDFGRVKTFIVAGLLLIIQCVELGIVIRLGAMVLLPLLGVFLTLEAGIMVLAKYNDKASRGAK